MNDETRHMTTRVLDEGDIVRAWGAVRDLSNEFLDWKRWSALPPTLSGWWGGVALHLAYHHRLEPSVAYEQTVNDLVDLGMSVAPRMRWPGFYGGISGIGWGLDHISRKMGDECELDDLDEFLVTVVERDVIRDQELIGGLAGIGFYGIERIQHENARRLVTAIVLKLEAQARQQGDGLAWFKHPEFLGELQLKTLPDGCWNLGLSHGIPGAISFLSFAVRHGVCADVAAHLVEQSVPWLMKQYYQAGARWHVSTTVEGPRPERSRLAWCYNELGTTMPILDAGEVLDRNEWRSFAAEVLSGLASLPLADSGVGGTQAVPDPAICHGIAGIAHLFAHSARRLNDDALADAARRWMKALLDSRSPVHGIGGFPRIGAPDEVTKERPIENDAGFLEGASGVGLVLLAALADEEPGWNRILGM